MQLNEIRKEMQFNAELVRLIETLKNIAAAQYHIMEKEKERFYEFMDAFSGFFRVVNLASVRDPLVDVMSDVTGIVVITSDSGFMGGLNQGVIRAALKAEEALPDGPTQLIVIGDKGASVFSDQDRQFKGFHGINQETIYEQAVEIKEYIVGEVLAKRMGRVIVAYPKPVSFTAQTIEVINLLPCAELFDSAAKSEVAEHYRGKNEPGPKHREVIIESSFSDMVEYLAATWIVSKLFEVFEDSKLAEFSARAVHLEGSFQKLQKAQKKIQHQYFKASHEKIDKGMRECFAASKKKKRKRVTPIE